MKKLAEYIIENNSDYIIKEYHQNNPEEWKYISDHKSEIFDFMNSGYIAAGYKSFKGCSDEKSLKKNSVLIKIAFVNDIYVAISIYSEYRSGNKCVGITATIDPKYRNIGKEAVKEIIKTDCKNYEQYFWCECSGRIETYYEKYGGIPIHNVYAADILERDIKLLEPDDTYHYSRVIDDEECKKVIYGFNSKETFDKVYSQCSEEIDKYIYQMKKKHESMNESLQRTKYKICVSILTNFIDLTDEERYHEIPQKYIDIMKENIEFLKSQTKEFGYTQEEYHYMDRLIEISESYLAWYQPLELHKL